MPALRLSHLFRRGDAHWRAAPCRPCAAAGVREMCLRNCTPSCVRSSSIAPGMSAMTKLLSVSMRTTPRCGCRVERIVGHWRPPKRRDERLLHWETGHADAGQHLQFQTQPRCSPGVPGVAFARRAVGRTLSGCALPATRRPGPPAGASMFDEIGDCSWSDVHHHRLRARTCRRRFCRPSAAHAVAAAFGAEAALVASRPGVEALVGDQPDCRWQRIPLPGPGRRDITTEAHAPLLPLLADMDGGRRRIAY